MQEDIGRGNTLSFGKMTMMPGITIDGRDYRIAYEQLTEEHFKGIPVRKDGRTIGYVESLADGQATFKLNEGETLELAPEPQLTFSLGNTAIVGREMETTLLENVDHVFRSALNKNIGLEDGNESSK